MENRKKVTKNLLFSIIGQILTIAVGLLLPRLYIVNYGSEVNGLLNSLNQFLVYLALFESGIGAVTLQALYAPVAKEDWENINSILSATNVYYKRAGKWYLCALTLLALLFPFTIQSELKYVTIFLSVIFSGIGNVIMFYCQGKYKLLLQAEGKNYIITNLTTIVTILTSISKVLLIINGFDVIIVLAVSCIIGLIQTIYIAWYIKTKYKKIKLNVKPNYLALKQKNYMLIHQISGMVFQNTDVLLITYFCGLKIVSIYSIYKLIITHIESMLSIFSNAFNFVLGQTFQINKSLYKERIDLFEMIYGVISFSVYSVALNLFVPFVKLYTSGVSDVKYVDYKLAFLFITIALLTVMRTPMLLTINYAGHFKLTTIQTVTEAIINLIISIIMIIFLGIYGALIGTIVALLYRTNDIIIYSNRKILNRSPMKTYKFYIINILVIIFIESIFSIISMEVNNYISLIITGFIEIMISLSIFSLFQLVFSPIERKYIFTKIKVLRRR